MKTINGHQFIQLFESWAPKSLAMEGDPIGLHIGQLNRPITNVLITLDVNEEVIDEAIRKNANFILAHHPPLFRPVKSIDTSTSLGRMIEKCIKHEISVYAAHTNLDIANGGVNDLMAEKLGLKQTDVLVETSAETLYKIIVFSPSTHAEQLRAAFAEVGAGSLGEYKACSFSSVGEGRFTPMAEAEPFIGQKDVSEIVEEEKIEVIVPQSILSKSLKAMHNAHPYEEPAFDVIQLDQKGERFGLGRIGTLQSAMSLKDFADHVKEVFQVSALRFVGDATQMVKKVAVLGGDGNKYIHAAKRKGADVYVTGDLYFHVAQDAQSIDLAVIDPGHHVEKVMIEGVVNYLSAKCADKQFDVTLLPSETNTEPFQFL